jgi:hypothetical protein
MESATISALAALGGATVGGITSFATTWLSQQSQARVQRIGYKLSQREKLYKVFIQEASKLYADALVHQIDDISKLVGLYAMINEMRVVSARTTVEKAENVGRMIVNTYLAPDKTIPELQEMMNGGGIDVLQSFSQAARQEFRRLGA